MESPSTSKSIGHAPNELENIATVYQENKIPSWRLVVLSFTLCCGLFLSLLDTTIVAITLYTIGADFHAPIVVNWIVLAYLLAYLGCATFFASIGNVIGPRNAYIGAFAIFLAFSIGCGFAHSIEALIACRAVQGMGGSGLYTLALVIFNHIDTPKMRQWVPSMVGLVIAIAGVLGPILGGIITHYTTWRWIFWINIPFGILPLLLFMVAWPTADQMAPIERRRFREMDLTGCALLIAASVLSVFAFQQAGLDSNAWRKPVFIAPIVVGLLCWLLLMAWEVAVARYWESSVDAVIPIRLLKHRVFSLGAFATLLVGFTYLLVLYNLPFRFETVNLKSPLGAGVSILPLVGGAAIGSMTAGLLCAKKDRTFHVAVAGACSVVLGSALLSTLENSIHVSAKAYGYQVFVGLGFGLTLAAVSVMATFEVELRDVAIAHGIIAQFRSFGGALGLATSAAIRGAVEQRELGGTVTPDDLALLATTAGGSDKGRAEDLRQAFTDAFNESMVVCAIIAGICLVVSLFTFRRNPASPVERRKANLIQEIRRRIEKQVKIGNQSASGEGWVGTEVINIEPKSSA